jgi:hypothetical protein
MKTQISRNLERCSEIADQLQDSAVCMESDVYDSEALRKEVSTLAQELERLIEDLFVMTRTEDAREASTDQQLLDAGRDPDAGVDRAHDMLMDQPTARDEMPETMEELADREEPDMESTLREMAKSSDLIASVISGLNQAYLNGMNQGSKS